MNATPTAEFMSKVLTEDATKDLHLLSKETENARQMNETAIPG